MPLVSFLDAYWLEVNKFQLQSARRLDGAFSQLQLVSSLLLLAVIGKQSRSCGTNKTFTSLVHSQVLYYTPS
ncbi:uncharacterized [Tachysurus ichikawai]